MVFAVLLEKPLSQKNSPLAQRVEAGVPVAAEPLTISYSTSRFHCLRVCYSVDVLTGAGHFCRPLHVAVQTRPCHPPRGRVGVWSLRGTVDMKRRSV